MIIKAYGLHWNPELVEWGPQGGNHSQLKGVVKIKNKKAKGYKQYTIDFWNSQGLYVLQHEFRTVYVGRTTRQDLGKRLRDHIYDEFAGRWDSFSWFIVNKINTTRKTVGRAAGRKASHAQVISTLEAISIHVANPPMNRKRERIKDAHEAKQTQSVRLKTTSGYLQAILKKMDEQALKTQKK